MKLANMKLQLVVLAAVQWAVVIAANSTGLKASQQVVVGEAPLSVALEGQRGSPANNKSQAHKCSRQSIILARQTLANQLELINNFNSIWFNDLDHEELLEQQKESLGNIIMSGAAPRLLSSEGQPQLEIEASGLRAWRGPLAIRLMRRHQDRCQLNVERDQFAYVFGLTLGPLEHQLDVAHNLPKELRLSQPSERAYGQVRLRVERMQYEVGVRQAARQRLLSGGCPLELADVTHLGPTNGEEQQVEMEATNLAATNQTSELLGRLFQDYTRPTVSRRLRQVLKFYLNSKTLPLSS